MFYNGILIPQAKQSHNVFGVFYFFCDNFTKAYRTILRFEKMILNYQTSQTNVFKFPNVLSDLRILR
jgi:hypothetical protein